MAVHTDTATKVASARTASIATVAPLSDRAVVVPLEGDSQTHGGLFIPDNAKEKPQQGKVVAVGPGRFEKNVRVPMEIKVGDKVLYGKYSGSEITLDGKPVIILRESDILAILG